MTLMTNVHNPNKQYGLPRQSIGLVLKNENKHNKSKYASVTKIYYNIKLTKTKARFGRLL